MSLSPFINTCLLAVATTWMATAAAQQAAPAKSAPERRSNDRSVIEKSVESYVAAFNAKDAKALAAHWSPEGVYIDRTSGERVTGRESLEKTFQELFQGKQKTRLDVTVESIEFISPNVALEQGTATVVEAESDPILTSYSAVHTKRDGKWLIDRISEEEVVTPPSHYEQLKGLEWMIGDWVDQAGAGSVTTECHWSRNNNFIIRSFTLALDGSIDMAGMQIIGWDPARNQIRSWTFDSDGGFNTGTWRPSGQQWMAQTTATLPDGTLASSTSIMKPLDENSFSWQQVDRVAGGELLPNLAEIVIVRNSAQ